MHPSATFLRRLLPALLLAGLTLASCGLRKDCDPKPKNNKCGTPAATGSTTPGGHS